MTQTAKRKLYRVSFLSQGKVYEVFVRKVSQSGLYAFVEIEQLVFGERSGVVVDPAEEKLKTEFADVVRSYIPMHAVLRIDEVSKQGIAKILEAGGEGSKVTPFPIYTSGDRKG
jgi:hypothetical protein